MSYRLNSFALPSFSAAPPRTPRHGWEDCSGVSRELNLIWSALADHEQRLRAAEHAPESTWEGAMRQHGWKVVLGLLALVLSRLSSGSWPGVAELVALLR